VAALYRVWRLVTAATPKRLFEDEDDDEYEDE